VADLLSLLRPRFPLPPSHAAGVTAAERALAEDAWWAACARQAIEWLASTGEPFAADDALVECGLTEPRTPGQLGAAFRTAAKAGLIVAVGARQSTTPSRRGGLTRVWRGASA
jgi:hypothetical protein